MHMGTLAWGGLQVHLQIAVGGYHHGTYVIACWHLAVDKALPTDWVRHWWAGGWVCVGEGLSL